MSNRTNNNLPSFSPNNNMMRHNVNFDSGEDDVGEEVTRRIDFTPSINPMLAMPSMNSKNENISASNELVSSSTTSTKIQSSSNISWNLTHAPTVPAFGHPLELTSVLVPNVTASEMASRVSNILDHQLTTIEVEYEENEADCCTCDKVEFSVCLYSATGADAGGIIVEVHRYSGNTFSFYPTVTKVILDGVQKQQEQKADTGDMECYQDVDEEAPSVDFAIRMLRQVETQQLGLEILCSMTDSNSKKMVSQLLVSNDKFVKLVFDIIQEDEAEVRMSCLMLLWNIIKCGVVMQSQQQECIVPLLRSDQAQVVFLAAQCLQPMNADVKVEAETLRQAHQLGQDKHHAALCRSVLSLSNNTVQAVC
mmetsp:Transcript_35/g.47  ORF Transcript_35/g.47 Transcript_35/m.47 type:complete len:365 (+) Transcript_35:73-1167(+)